MSKLHLLVLLGAAVATSAQACSSIGGRVGASGCCDCREGYKGLDCGECDTGYVASVDAATGEKRCGAGRRGAPCVDGLAYPYWGCAHPVDGSPVGKCSRNAAGESVFPCLCAEGAGGECDSVVAGALAQLDTCYPAGPRMFTTFPNEPLAGEKFNLTVVGCKLGLGDRYIVVPESTPCAEVPLGWTAGQGCAGVNGNGTGLDVAGDCLAEGAQLVALQQGDVQDAPRAGMSEASFAGVTIAEEGKFRVCYVARDAAGVERWEEVPSHNRGARDEHFNVCSDLGCGGGRGVGAAGAADDEEGCVCDDGLLLGDWCVPTWLVVLLFLLLCSCMFALLMALRKKEQDRMAADAFVEKDI